MDIQEGLGVETFVDGSKFTGNFINGLKEGEGKFEWNDESFYEGNFENN